MMAGLLNFTVETLLNQQIELIGPAAVSLDSLCAQRVLPPSILPETGWNWPPLYSPGSAATSRISPRDPSPWT